MVIKVIGAKVSAAAEGQIIIDRKAKPGADFGSASHKIIFLL